MSPAARAAARTTGRLGFHCMAALPRRMSRLPVPIVHACSGLATANTTLRGIAARCDNRYTGLGWRLRFTHLIQSHHNELIRRVAVSGRVAQPGRGYSRRLHPLRQMRRRLPDGRAGRDRPGRRRGRCRIVGGVLDLLAGGEGTPEAERWAQVCTNSGKCIPACDYGVNPRFMVNMARIAAKAKQGDADGAARRARILHDDEPQHAGDLAAAARARGGGADQPAVARRGRIPGKRRTSCSIPAAT